ncbi:TonB-dependent siderophore receptor [Belnapia sp. T18]|uniref:TonB-dependent siderophore receptor n=1 Tax=Belnapia arida TaxID=2804533 RepID=A0ABS1U5W2_9PROT|nr:TonB-dependent siderophore receptor [Belnapia arida]MBL6080054.1 TonB-dependent siderophore receptor [Belnapia arida]
MLRPNFPAVTLTLAVILALQSVAQTTAEEQAAGEAVLLPELAVTAAGERADGPVDGYRATRSVSATRTDTSIREIPQSISVVPRAVLDDTAAVRVDAALDYVGGVARGNNFGGQTLYEYNVRGFATGEYYRNGFPLNRGYQGSPDTAAVERLEVLRGPASLLYGRGDPGGTLNIVTKQPMAETSAVLGGLFGSHGFWRGTVDAAGALRADGSASYRLNGAVEGGGSFRNHVESSRQYLAPAFTWRVSPDTAITLESEFLHNDRTFDRGVVAYGNRPGVIPRDRFLGEPGVGTNRNTSGLGQLRFDHRINNDWSLRGGVQYFGGNLEGRAVEPSSLLADGRTLRRELRGREFAWNDLDVQLNLVGRFTTGPVSHTLLAGLEYERYHNREILNRSNPGISPFAIDILSPAYGQRLPALTRRSNTLENSSNYAAYLQDQISLTGRLKLVAGIRVEHFDQDFSQRSTGIASPQTQTAATPRVGLIYELTGNVSAYASYAQSFRPNRGGDIGGRSFAPERGEAYEVGAKFDLFDDRLSATAALFHITKANVLTANPADTSYSIAAGEVRSRGFDLTLAGNPLPGWRMIGGYAYIDAEVTRDAALRPGTRLLNVPRHSASLLNVYEFQAGSLQGLGLGGGVNLVGSRAGDTVGSAFRLPAYATVDLLAYYRIGDRVRLNLNVNNLFDRTYYDRSYSSVWVSPGAPLTLLGGVTIRL